MLNYEKKLHFDQHYQKLQELSSTARHGSWHRVTALLLAAVCYAPLYYGAKYLLALCPDLPLWRHTALWFWAGPVPVYLADVLYFVCGFALFCWGGAQLGAAGAQTPGKTRTAGTPPTLLTNGIYAKVRHPMYGAFILLQSGFLLSLRSLAGLLLALLIIAGQYANAAAEEHRTLLPLFGEAYTAYRAKVPQRLFRHGEAALFLFAVLLSAAGLFF